MFTAHIGRQRRTPVESEPSEPQQTGSQNDVGDVVRFEIGCIALTFTDDYAIGQTGGAGRNVNWSAA